jgi:hypothetical protein
VRFLILAALLVFAGNASAQSYPDGTLALSSSRGLIGRIAQRITGQRYTHVGVVIGGYVYDHDFPRAHRTPVARYVKRGWTTDYYTPATPYTPGQVAAMRSAAHARLGERYELRHFWNHTATGTSGQWCSPYAGHVLNASGRYHLSAQQVHTPGNLHTAVGPGYRFAGRVVR